MSREIKFRAWHKKEKRMDLVTFWDFVAGGLVFTGEETLSDEALEAQEDTPIRRALTDECEIMQFIGLLDKNGKKIFEGDIVKAEDFSQEILEVKFNEGCFCVSHPNIVVSYTISYFNSSRGLLLEVIGNIYENPELL